MERTSFKTDFESRAVRTVAKDYFYLFKLFLFRHKL